MKNLPMGTYKIVRDKKGRFSSFKKKLKITFGCLVVLGIAYVSGAVTNPIAIATPVFQDNLGPKIEQLKDELVEDIKKCESKGHKESDGIIIFDSNNEASIGNFQYQRKTVIHYQKVLYGKTITPKEAIHISLDEEESRKMTKDIIFKDSKGWRNWYNCGVKVGAQSRLNIIKELEK